MIPIPKTSHDQDSSTKSSEVHGFAMIDSSLPKKVVDFEGVGSESFKGKTMKLISVGNHETS
jgi:hypothetical protein